MTETMYSYRMPENLMEQHEVDTLVIGCVDFRMQDANRGFVKEGLGIEYADYRTIAGGAKNLISELESNTDLIKTIEGVSIGLHKIKRIVLLSHWDCGAYGSSKHFSSASEEEETLRNDLVKAQDYLTGRFPELEVVIAFNKLEGDSLVYSRVEDTAEKIEMAA